MSGGQDLFTLKEIAQRLNLPESTLRKYRDAYPQFIPYVGSGREKRYRAEAEKVFMAIRESRVENHLSWEDTERELSEIFPMNPDELRKRAAVSEDEANIFIEKMERAVAKLTEQAERQEFIVTTLAGELIRIREIVEKLAPAVDDIKQTRKMTYSYTETSQRQLKQGQDNMRKALDLLEQLQGAIYYMPKDIAARLEKMSWNGAAAAPRASSRPAAPAVPDIEITMGQGAANMTAPTSAPPPPPQPARVEAPSIAFETAPQSAATNAALKEELRRRDEELAKFKELYIRAKREAERIKDDLRKKTVDEVYGKSAPRKGTPPPPQPGAEPPEPEKGGKLFFRGKKKKPGDA